jgi:hypothetical protein
MGVNDVSGGSMRIFVIFHNDLNLDYFPSFLLPSLVFVNVNPANPHRYNHVRVLNLYELAGFIPLGKWYTETEVIYNVYKDPSLLEGVDHVGFIHYDLDFGSVREQVLQDAMRVYDLINFQPYPFRFDLDQRILMDPDQPDVRSGDGRNCYLSIFEDFSRHYGKNHNLEQYLDRNINLCSCFLIKRDLFYEMMEFAAAIIESRKLDAYDSNRKYRIQGGFMERYYGVWCMVMVNNSLDMKIKHDFIQTHKQMPLLHRIKNRLASLVRNQPK